MRHIYVFILFGLFASCNGVNRSENDYSGKSNLELAHLDSLVIHGHGNLLFDDYKNNKLLFHNYMSKDIVIFDISSRRVDVFNRFGSNYENYRQLIHNLKFYNDSTIVVGGLRNLKFYSLNGDFKGEISVKRPKANYSPIQHLIFLSDSVFVYYESLQGDSSKKSFYKGDTIISVYDLHKGLIKRFGLYPEPESDYNDPEHYYIYPFLFHLKRAHDTLYVASYNDLHLYAYHIPTGKKIKVLTLLPKYYTAYKRKFALSKKYSYNKMLQSIMQISIINGLDIADSLIFLGYTKAIGPEELQAANSLDELQNPQCLYVISKNGNVLYDDKLPSDFGDFLFYRNDSLYFMARPTQESEDRNYTVIYKVKWNAE